MRRIAALIVGGGPAGSAAAITLSARGLSAELIERTVEPHDVVCGGFLGWDALAALRRLGIDPDDLRARPIRRLRLCSATRQVEADLPGIAAGLSRRCLDEALLAAAAARGANIRRGVRARGLDKQAGLVALDEDEEVSPRSLILATGKYELRGLARAIPKERGEGAVGLRTAIAPTPDLQIALDGIIELHLFDGGYAGLLIQEDGQVNLCMSVAAARLRTAGGVQPLLAQLGNEHPRLGERLGAAAGGDWISVSNVPYGWRAGPSAPDLYRVGDQASVIASLAGDGVAIALTSGIAAAGAMLAGRSGRDYQRDWSARAGSPLKVADTLRHAAERHRSRPAMMNLARAPGLAGLAARLTRIG